MMKCPLCGAELDWVRYEENGAVALKGDEIGAVSKATIAYHCPECDEEIGDELGWIPPEETEQKMKVR